ncbi:hypothetical protein GQX73_g1513 [Xylaria multiplex]|uniref:Carbohydrate kinase PfkB domain-containing protein n=1 Tax=Xylaria multiplex TaxID=323545 RepID=A0A7C8IVH9_9PEZI|nr:hypothetical protein GQX73_g1513 [Xylaria multiplex]
MRLHSGDQISSSAVIAVVGGVIQDLIFEIERMPANNESLDATSFAYMLGGKGSNTSVAIYRAQHKEPVDHSSAGKSAVTSTVTLHYEDHEGNANATPSSDDDDDKGAIVQVYPNTAVGDDPFGCQLKKRLSQNGVNVSGVRKMRNEKTGTCAVFVDSYTGQSRDIGYPGANIHWTPKDNSVECLANDYTPDLVIAHLETKRETIESVLQMAHNSGVDTLLNLSPPTYFLSSTYTYVTHLLVNEQEAAELSGIPLSELVTTDKWSEAANHFLKWGVKNVVITLGDKGAFYATKDKEGHVPAVENIQVKDTIGAGDSFLGNYALEYVLQKQHGEWDIVKAVIRGCKAAARTIEQIGDFLKSLEYGVYLASVIQALHEFVLEDGDAMPKGRHQDLKPDNVPVEGTRLILAEFGPSSMKDSSSESNTPLKRKKGYCQAPECSALVRLFQEHEMTPANDIFTFACITIDWLVYLLNGHLGLTTSRYKTQAEACKTPLQMAEIKQLVGKIEDVSFPFPTIAFQFHSGQSEKGVTMLRETIQFQVSCTIFIALCEDQDEFYWDILFKYPESKSHEQSREVAVTFRAYLIEQKDVPNMPPLENRFRLAFQLAEGLSAFHDVDTAYVQTVTFSLRYTNEEFRNIIGISPDEELNITFKAKVVFPLQALASR